MEGLYIRRGYNSNIRYFMSLSKSEIFLLSGQVYTMITEKEYYYMYYHSHQSLKYSSSVLCLPEARLLQFRDATISTAEATTVACSLASRKALTSSSELMASPYGYIIGLFFLQSRLV